MQAGVPNGLVFIDAHVHIHDCFPLPEFFRAAFTNFRNAARQRGAETYAGILLLSETARADHFGRLRGMMELDGLQVRPTKEECSLIVASDGGEKLFIAAGRQIVTEEGLEVLALGTDMYLGDGRPIDEVIKVVRAAGAIAVLPWGFGKWLGRRRSVIDGVIDRAGEGAGFFLGDNSSRPAFTGVPGQFARAAQKGIRILSGSDPLPFSSERRRPGSFGSIVPGRLGGDRPVDDLKRLLLHDRVGTTPYGESERFLPFVRNQVAMQFVKRFR